MRTPHQPDRRPASGTGPDPLALIQRFEDHFSCCAEWIKIKDEGFFGAPRRSRRTTRPAAAEATPRPSG